MLNITLNITLTNTFKNCFKTQLKNNETNRDMVNIFALLQLDQSAVKYFKAVQMEDVTNFMDKAPRYE